MNGVFVPKPGKHNPQNTQAKWKRKQFQKGEDARQRLAQGARGNGNLDFSNHPWLAAMLMGMVFQTMVRPVQAKPASRDSGGGVTSMTLRDGNIVVADAKTQHFSGKSVVMLELDGKNTLNIIGKDGKQIPAPVLMRDQGDKAAFIAKAGNGGRTQVFMADKEGGVCAVGLQGAPGQKQPFVLSHLQANIEAVLGGGNRVAGVYIGKGAEEAPMCKVVLREFKSSDPDCPDTMIFAAIGFRDNSNEYLLKQITNMAEKKGMIKRKYIPQQQKGYTGHIDANGHVSIKDKDGKELPITSAPMRIGGRATINVGGRVI